MRSEAKKITVIFLLSLLGSGLLSVYFGKELCWDLANYHFYNPFALIYSRRELDFFPSSYIHQFLNPTIDLLTYFLIQFFSPLQAEFILGTLHGINFIFLFLIARLFIKAAYKNLLAASFAFLGMYGPTAWPGIGSFQNDNLISVFVLTFLFLQLRELNFPTSPKGTTLILSGFILGLGIGLKYTAGIFLLGAVAAQLMLPYPLQHRLKNIVVLSSGTGLGIIVTAGFWMLKMWTLHHNPLFPFFNQLFHAKDFSIINWRDLRFLPQGFLKTIFYPFYFSYTGETADAPFRDFRFAMVYALFLFAAIYRIRSNNKFDLKEIWLFGFFVVSYVVWQFYFSIARYLVTLEMLSPLIIYLIVIYAIKKPILQLSILGIVFYTLFFMMEPIPMIRARWYQESFFNTQLPRQIDFNKEALVLVAYAAYVNDNEPRPQLYLIPYLPPKWRYVGIPFWYEHYLGDPRTASEIAGFLTKARNKPVYLLTTEHCMPALFVAAQKFGIVPNGECEKILSDRQKVTHEDTLLCSAFFR